MKKAELKTLKDVVWMGYLWAQSLRDANAVYKRDLKKARRAWDIIMKEIAKDSKS